MQFLTTKFTRQSSLDFQLQKPSLIAPMSGYLVRELIELAEVYLSCKVPNYAMSLFRTVTIGFPGSFIVDVVGLTFKILEPGARTSYKPSKFFFERRLLCIYLASLS